MLLELALFAAAAVSAGALTWIVRKQALVHGMLDVPNERSSHAVPTPRGGGIGFVFTLVAGIVGLRLAGWLRDFELIALLPGAIAVAAVGYMDDKRGLTARTRFAVHLTAASIAIGSLVVGGASPQIFPWLPYWIALGLVIVGTVWSINLFNFMDGIDGIAGSQALFVAASSAGLIGLTGGPEAWVLICVLTAGACTGFLAWNWPSAKIFMGDVGSGFLGFWLAVVALALHISGALTLWSSLILGMVFVADTTATLIRRILAGEKWYVAHRSHAYQHLARRFGQHRRVVLITWLVNLLVGLPLAYFAQVERSWGPWVAIAFFVLLATACVLCGAGESEQPHPKPRDTAASYGT